MNKIIEEDIKTILDEKMEWNKLSNKSVLIIGGSGHIASYFVFTLLLRNRIFESNIKISILCKNKEKAYKKYGEYLVNGELKLIVNNVCDKNLELPKTDYIIYMANPSVSQTWGGDNLISTIEANVLGLNNVLEICKDLDVNKILFFSTAAVYGLNTHGKVDETFRGAIDFADAGYCYSMSKQMCEMMIAVYHKCYNMNIDVIRPFVTYGPGMAFSSRKNITDFVKNYIYNEDITLLGDGTAVRSYIYITDLVNAVFRILLSDVTGQTYNISSEKNMYSIGQMAEFFTQFDKKINIKYMKERTAGKDYKNISIISGTNQKIKELQWEEKVSLREGLWRTVKWAESIDFINT